MLKAREAILLGALSSWFVASVISQHPDRSYDKLRKFDKTGIFIPNWRFFAPEPAVEDQHFLYRLATADKSSHTEWRSVYEVAPRRAIHGIWFPGRRIEKSIFDVAATLTSNTNTNNPMTERARESAYRLIVDFVRNRVQPEPDHPLMQLMLVRYAGYDHSEDPKYDLIMDYEPVAP
ncbi:hypothetical protein ACFYL6_15370 [Micromonospora sp. NPDC007208]|uniref:hypothetical protein n=1 Tax=Micromonospora sp. NPDC007208 TaxID=3364236 RepID=UPI0036881252